MSEEGNIDDIFRQKLGNHSVKPPEKVWSNIDSNLDNNGKKGFPFFRWTILALIICGGITGAYFGLNYGTSETNSIELSENKTDANLTFHEAEETNENQAESNPTIIELWSKTQIPLNETQALKPNKNSQIASKQSSTNNPEPETHRSEINSVFVVDPGIEISVENTNDKTDLNDGNQIISSPEGGSFTTETRFSDRLNFENEPLQIGLNFMTPKIIGFENLSPELTDPQMDLTNVYIKHHPWSVGAYYEANWNFKRIDTKIGGNPTLDSLVSSESNTFSSGFGINVAYTTKIGIRISSGIEYSKWCRSASYPVTIPLTLAPGYTGADDTFKGELLGPTGNQLYGVDNEELPFFEGVALSPEPLNFDIDIHECYSAIGIPLRIGYQLNMGNWNLVPELGFTYNRLIHSELEGDASYELNSLKLRRENDYSKDIFSFSSSLGLERDINEFFRVGLIGSYRYWLTPVYTTEAFETHPYIFSGRLAIWHTIK